MDLWEPDGWSLRPDECCANCTHWHKLTDKVLQFGEWPDEDTINEAMPRGTERRAEIAKKICANVGICGYWVENAELTGEEEPNYLTCWDEEPTGYHKCDFIPKEDG